MLESVLVTVTLAMGMAAPVLSVTVPRIVPVAPACPSSLHVETSRMIGTRENRSDLIS
jgi:hypothetical protein